MSRSSNFYKDLYGGQLFRKTDNDTAFVFDRNKHRGATLFVDALSSSITELVIDNSAMQNGDSMRIISNAPITISVSDGADMIPSSSSVSGIVNLEMIDGNLFSTAGCDPLMLLSDMTTIVAILSQYRMNRYDATAAPDGTRNDVTEGYGVGSIWVDVTADEAYICLDNADGSAKWTKITYNPPA